MSDSQHPGSAPTGPPQREAAVRWFARLRADDVTPAEERAFAEWLAADPSHGRAYRQVAELWAAPAFERAARRQADPLAMPSTPNPAKPHRSVWHPLRRGLALAAVVLLALGIVRLGGLDIASRADYHTLNGTRQTVILPDGSRLTLNTDSAVMVDFDGPIRRIQLLVGEAYFAVEADPSRPFQVRAGPAKARVLGTRFAVRKVDDAAVITVRGGRVAVRQAGADGVANLTRGQRLRVTAKGLGAVETVNLDTALAWLRGRLIFRNRPLAQVIAEIDRYHPGWLIVANKRLAETRVSGNYKLDDPAAIVASLADITHADRTRLTDYLTILH